MPDTAIRHPVRHHVPAALRAIAAVATLLAPVAQAQTDDRFVAKYGFDYRDYHCCGSYPLVPPFPRGQTITITGGGGGKLQSYGAGGAERTADYGASAGPGSIRGSLQVLSSTPDGQYNQILTNGGMDLTWTDTVRIQAPGLATGTSVPVRLSVAALYLAGTNSGNGSVFGRSFAFSADYPVSLSEYVLSFKVGVDTPFVANVGATALAEAGQSRRTDVDYTEVALLWLLEPVASDQQLIDGKGNPMQRYTPFMEGLFATRPFQPTQPNPTKSGQFSFQTQVLGGPMYYFDPPTTSGYEYEVLSGPSITDLLLPAGGDGHYRVELWDGTAWVDTGLDVLAGQKLDLAALRTGGVTRLRVQGIETGDGTAADFVTGLGFSGTGELSLRQTALPVPEPATWGLWLGGLAGLGAWARRRRRALT